MGTVELPRVDIIKRFAAWDGHFCYLLNISIDSGVLYCHLHTQSLILRLGHPLRTKSAHICQEFGRHFDLPRFNDWVLPGVKEELMRRSIYPRMDIYVCNKCPIRSDFVYSLPRIKLRAYVYMYRVANLRDLEPIFTYQLFIFRNDDRFKSVARLRVAQFSREDRTLFN